MRRFFESLYASLARGARAVLQMYPENTDQVRIFSLCFDTPKLTRMKLSNAQSIYLGKTAQHRARYMHCNLDLRASARI